MAVKELVCEPASKKDVEANLHSSGVTWQAVTQQGTEVEAEINQVETTCELECRYRADICVILKRKLDPKEVLEEVHVRTSLKRWAETSSGNDA